MKKAIVLSLVLVMALSVSAMAATTNKLGGYVKYFMEKVGNADPVWKYDFRLNFTGTVDDVSGYQVRFNQDSSTAFAPNRYNFWTKLPVGKLVLGKAAEDMTGLNNYAFSGYDYLVQGYTGIGFYPTVSDNVKVFGFYDPGTKTIGGQAKYSADALSVFGGGSKKESDTDAKFAVGASYVVIPEQLSVYGQYNAQGNTNEQVVGGKYTVSGVDCVLEYLVQAKEIAFDVTKTFQGIDWNFNYTKPESGDATLTLAATLNF
ncbi:MAG: hypothetical protein QME79_04910 [Bacillota bacterium]|nr:hypothetical protein [Bacillota bacterium]